ncbi:TetR/AcrR family transcriptional regulator [Tsukamurella sputi]|uniref:TetR/AcrR family transcriptional regulator n=1 Tax=Tsukamurella sputi TaxID=2591848 RepID=A0A5C5RTG1_9ACTN|nr:TetR/AcrR family transcriptional regulator [Tsukamurella sputi]TWS26024.1 TetR/AcrR family transcriptional regulator [Tsukamurella sputi]
MTDTESGWRAFAVDPLPQLLRGALAHFVAQGYNGTTIRQLAASADLSVPGLYHHYASKQDLLVGIVDAAMADLWWRSESALREAGDDLLRRLDMLIECLVLFHANRRELAFIAVSEMRSLEPEAYARYIANRDRQQKLMDDVVEEGVVSGVFTTPFPHEVSRAVVTMCTGVAQWFRHSGALTPEELAERYRVMARMAVGAPLG